MRSDSKKAVCDRLKTVIGVGVNGQKRVFVCVCVRTCMRLLYARAVCHVV